MIEELTHRAERALAKLEHAAEFMESKYFEGMLEEAVQDGLAKLRSPWVDRRRAAAHCRCSITEIDRAAKMGFIKRFDRGGTPLFSKTDLNTAIASGRWRPLKKTQETTTESTP